MVTTYSMRLIIHTVKPWNWKLFMRWDSLPHQSGTMYITMSLHIFMEASSTSFSWPTLFMKTGKSFIVLHTYWDSFHADKYLATQPQALLLLYWIARYCVALLTEKNSLLRRSRRNYQAFISFSVVVYIVTIIRANTALSSLILFQSNFLGTFFWGLPDHLTWDGNYVPRPIHWVGRYINQPIFERYKEGHHLYGRP